MNYSSPTRMIGAHLMIEWPTGSQDDPWSNTCFWVARPDWPNPWGQHTAETGSPTDLCVGEMFHDARMLARDHGYQLHHRAQCISAAKDTPVSSLWIYWTLTPADASASGMNGPSLAQLCAQSAAQSLGRQLGLHNDQPFGRYEAVNVGIDMQGLDQPALDILNALKQAWDIARETKKPAEAGLNSRSL